MTAQCAVQGEEADALYVVQSGIITCDMDFLALSTRQHLQQVSKQVTADSLVLSSAGNRLCCLAAAAAVACRLWPLNPLAGAVWCACTQLACLHAQWKLPGDTAAAEGGYLNPISSHCVNACSRVESPWRCSLNPHVARRCLG